MPELLPLLRIACTSCPQSVARSKLFTYKRICIKENSLPPRLLIEPIGLWRSDPAATLFIPSFNIQDFTRLYNRHARGSLLMP